MPRRKGPGPSGSATHGGHPSDGGPAELPSEELVVGATPTQGSKEPTMAPPRGTKKVMPCRKVTAKTDHAPGTMSSPYEEPAADSQQPPAAPPRVSKKLNPYPKGKAVTQTVSANTSTQAEEHLPAGRRLRSRVAALPSSATRSSNNDVKMQDANPEVNQRKAEHGGPPAEDPRTSRKRPRTDSDTQAGPVGLDDGPPPMRWVTRSNAAPAAPAPTGSRGAKRSRGAKHR
ncbi:hypothetical protein C8Q80DRAFT_1274759 [Daedaleopsis nitida]|nr:hypothetical protein C8Q80DRAFT_1274748 [Daedaleopsis nitida]KAI0739721.1 hypothetical protein C8Q80DRAFT_1274759 [Daedaleopsis nitida]